VQATLPSLQPQLLQLSPEGTALPSGNVWPAASHDAPPSPQSGSCEMHGSSGKREQTPSDSSRKAAQTTGSHSASVQITLPSLQPQLLQLSPEGTPAPSGNVCPATSQDCPLGSGGGRW
jgi:hypothetical protein